MILRAAAVGLTVTAGLVTVPAVLAPGGTPAPSAEPALPLSLRESIEANASDVLLHPNLVIYADGRLDIAAGAIDERVLRLLVALAERHTITVSSLATGHPRCAVNGQPHGPGCRISNHTVGRAADISAIDGTPVSARHRAAIELMRELAALEGALRPDEIGGPVDVGGDGVFTDANHAGHIHVGYDS